MTRKAFVTHPGPILDEASDSAMEDLAASMMNQITQSTEDEDTTVEEKSEPVEEVEVEPEPVSEPIPLM